MGKVLQERIDRGFTFLKMDIGVGLLRGIPGTLSAPHGNLDTSNLMHPFTGIRLTENGIAVLCEYVATVRDIIGYEVPLAVDHFGHIGIEDCIRLARALEKYNLAWLEDMVPWQYHRPVWYVSPIRVRPPSAQARISIAKRTLCRCLRVEGLP